MEEPERPPANPLLRYMQGVMRFKWLVVLFVLLGAAGGYFATKFIQPEYEVDASIAMQMGGGRNSQSSASPIQSEELLTAAGWIELLRSATVVDPVVEQLGLYVQPTIAGDSIYLREFHADQARLQPGQYSISVAGDRYTLKREPQAVVETGALGDSVGRQVGFIWQPSADSFGQRSEISFNVQTARETTKALLTRFRIRPPPLGSPFISTALRGKNPQTTANILNAWMDQFVNVAARLKKDRVTRQAVILQGQLGFTRQALANSEAALQRFRVQTVTQPSERVSSVPGIRDGIAAPAFQEYFAGRARADQINRDGAAFDSALADGKRRGGILPEAILSIPSVANDPAARRMNENFTEQLSLESQIRINSEKYFAEAPVLKAQLARLALLKDSVIPRAAALYREQVRRQERDLAEALRQNEASLKDIPVRTITEEALKRTRDQDEELYRTLDKWTNEARLAEAATIPDVKVMDVAVAPLFPTKNTAPIVFSAVVAMAFLLGVGLAVLLDQIDRRFRYASQATEDLGLFILGVVPVVSTKKRKANTEQAAQVVEAFRTIRMNVRYAAEPGRPLTLTITSPGPDDGKSLISSNLALSFAEAGSRTLLIDGDIRRGELAQTFGTQTRPGLVEYLDGTALIAEVLHPTNAHSNLTVMPAGARRRRAPELLATTRLPQLINQLATEYDVIVVDSPPLGAGADAFALATATGNLAIVLRSGVTDRKMAKAKLAIVETLPIRLMGAILNGIKLSGEYQYYAYYQDYAAEDEEPVTPRVTSGTSGRPTPTVVRAG